MADDNPHSPTECITMNGPPKPKKKRRWCQFGLRTLLVFILVAGVGFGWLGLRVQQARKHRAAVAKLQAIKKYREITGASLKEAKEYVEQLM